MRTPEELCVPGTGGLVAVEGGGGWRVGGVAWVSVGWLV
jgi:hypothetical protein